MRDHMGVEAGSARFVCVPERPLNNPLTGAVVVSVPPAYRTCSFPLTPFLPRDIAVPGREMH
jgi:hypothetical protein